MLSTLSSVGLSIKLASTQTVVTTVLAVVTVLEAYNVFCMRIEVRGYHTRNITRREPIMVPGGTGWKSICLGWTNDMAAKDVVFGKVSLPLEYPIPIMHAHVKWNSTVAWVGKASRINVLHMVCAGSVLDVVADSGQQWVYNRTACSRVVVVTQMLTL